MPRWLIAHALDIAQDINQAIWWDQEGYILRAEGRLKQLKKELAAMRRELHSKQK